MIQVLVNGSKGKMGAQTVQAVQDADGLQLVCQTDAGDNLAAMIQTSGAQVVVDFTHPDVVFENAQLILKAGVHAVIGTTGLTADHLAVLDDLAQSSGVGCAVCPNFAIGAVLMMQFAAKAARYMDRAEIIEFHHDRKADAPSGTAIKTAQMIHQENPELNTAPLDEKELISGSRGGVCDQIPIHSVRLPGMVAHQEVVLGSVGQTLTIRHDTINRESFMPGVVLACEKIGQVKGLVYGLENLL